MISFNKKVNIDTINKTEIMIKPVPQLNSVTVLYFLKRIMPPNNIAMEIIKSTIAYK